MLFAHGDDMGMFVFWFALCAIIFSSLIVIAVYDLRHTIIPDRMSLLFAVTAFVYLFFRSPLLYFYTHGMNVFNWYVMLPILTDIFSGIAFFLFFFLFWFFSKGTWMGLGDAKLAVGMGWFLGFSAGTASLMIAFWTGAIISVGLLAIGKLVKRLTHSRRFTQLNSFAGGLTIKSEVPFAPFLVLSVFIVFFSGVTLQTLQLFVGSILHI
jgi:prepilin signal peptidase PulO-like enzyme (type II secretory pathway)